MKGAVIQGFIIQESYNWRYKSHSVTTPLRTHKAHIIVYVACSGIAQVIGKTLKIEQKLVIMRTG